MAAPNECLRIIEEAAAGRLTDDELEAVIEELERIRRKHVAADDLVGLDQKLFAAAEELGKEATLAARLERRNRLINIVKETELLALARRARENLGDVSLGLEAAMVGINSPLMDGRRSVDAVSNGAVRTYLGGVVADLKAAGVLSKFNSGEMDREIARELWDLSLPEPTRTATGSRDAKAIATILHKYRRAAVDAENRAGAYIRPRAGYIVRQTHDAMRLERAGLEAWSREIAPRLDWAKMDIEPAERAKFLRATWEALVTGVRKSGAESDLEYAFKGPGNLAKKESASRVLLFRSADDWFDYDQRFGLRSLREAFVSDLTRAARSTALMDRFGTNPEAMFDKVRTKLKEENRSEPKAVRRLDRKTLDWQLAEIVGSVNAPASPTLASVGRTVRAIQTMAKLGGAFLSAIADPAAVAAQRRDDGASLAEAWTDAVRAPILGMRASADQRRVADLIGTGIDGALGDFVSRFAAQDDAPGRIAKYQALFFKLNLLGPWTDAIKRGVGLIVSRDLAGDAGLPWEALSEARKGALARFGFDASRWKVARLAVQEAADGRSYMMPSAVDLIADDAAPFSGLSGRRRQAVRDEVRLALGALIADAADAGSPTPGARDRAITRFGLQPGTPAGEAVRFLMQFKTFPIVVTQKIIGRAAYGRGAKSLSAAFLRGEGDVLGLATFIAGSTALGFMAMQAKEIAKGREPREATPDAVVAAMLQGGGLGLYGDFLFGEASRFGQSPLDAAVGPAVGAASDLLELVQRARAQTFEGESPDFWAQALRLTQSNVPFANLFYTKAVMDYLIVYQLQEAVNPGYLRRMERRAKRENNQEYFLPPSRAVPRGGGSRPLEGVRE